MKPLLTYLPQFANCSHMNSVVRFFTMTLMAALVQIVPAPGQTAISPLIGAQKSQHVLKSIPSTDLQLTYGTNHLLFGLELEHFFKYNLSARVSAQLSTQSLGLYSDWDYQFMKEDIPGSVAATYRSKHLTIPVGFNFYFGKERGPIRPYVSGSVGFSRAIGSDLKIHGRFLNEPDKPTRIPMDHMISEKWDVIPQYGCGIAYFTDKSKIRLEISRAVSLENTIVDVANNLQLKTITTSGSIAFSIFL